MKPAVGPASDTTMFLENFVMPNDNVDTKQTPVKYDKHGENNPCYRHGHSKRGVPNSPTYRTWKMMRNRCTNPNAMDYAYYGGRGITLCERWLDFSAFLEDMGERPSEAHCIERLDNENGYFKANCRWASRAEQSKNRRNCHMFEHKGEMLCLADIAKYVGIKYTTLRYRIIVMKLSINEALNWMPTRKGG